MLDKNLKQVSPVSRSPEHISFMLSKIQELWEKSPNLRLGQLLGNCANTETGRSMSLLISMDDDVLLKKIIAMCANRSDTTSGSFAEADR